MHRSASLTADSLQLTAKFAIGLTGGIASGKTTVSDHFASLGVGIVDADIIARQVVAAGQPALRQIAAHFGADFIQTDGQLNRRRLRQVIFSQPIQKQWLDDLLHPLIRQGIEQALAKAKGPYCILSAPLLLENQLQNLVERVVVVDIPADLQVQRTAQRDGVSGEHAQAIIQAQLPRAQRLAAADDVISNSGSKSALLQQVEILHQRYLTMV